jgi:phage recombination protein Bet
MTDTPALRREHMTEEEITLLKQTHCLGWSEQNVALFVHQCNRSGLDPLSRQIYGQLRWDKNMMDSKGKKVGGLRLTVVTSIDGFRLVAQRSGEYGGQQGPYWCGADGVWKDVWLPKTYPAAAKVGAWRTGFREPTFGVANFDAFAPTYDDGNLSGLWPKMFALMIAKCAEAQALRKAFPQELGSLYISEEMDQAPPPVDPTDERKPERLPDAAKGEQSAHAPRQQVKGADDGNVYPDPADEGEERDRATGDPEEPVTPPRGGLANSNALGGRLRKKPGKLSPAPTPDDPMRHNPPPAESDNDGAGFPEEPITIPKDQWEADKLRDLPTLGGKTLKELKPEQLQKLVDLGQSYIEQGEKRGKRELAARCLAGAKALVAFNDPANDNIPGL